MRWKCHEDESSTGRYDMILGRDLLTALVLDLKFYKNVIYGGEGPYKGCSAPILDINNYDFNVLIAKTVKPQESFINAYAKKCLKYEGAISSTRRMRIILYAKYKKSYLNKVMAEKCQHLSTK